MKKLRCAIYTRKSSEEGLDQSFNSLDAQREACGAYILSQAGEGWTATKDIYDDGGFSGGSMERPALKRLLADVHAGRVDVIVVYKVDRLTRSLADFARIIEILDKAGASFVSVTQAFSTTSSMGRLTLNVLLSFAQFEREVTGERIRDKIAASKARGLWMGGNPPLGYDVRERALHVNEAEAETVRSIFQRYLGVGNVLLLRDELDGEGIRSKRWVSKSGREIGGTAFSHGALYHILSNRLYRGEICHRDKVHPGQHEAIIDAELFDAVQKQLTAGAPVRESIASCGRSAPLLGKLFDANGGVLTSAHANKKGQRYFYYVSTANGARASGKTLRLPALALEQCIADAVASTLHASLQGSPDQLLKYVERITVTERELLIDLGSDAIDDTERLGLEHIETGWRLKLANDFHRAPSRRASLQATSKDPRTDRALIRAVVMARVWARDLASGDVDSIQRLAEREKQCPIYTGQLLPLAYLAPDLTAEILEGRHPPRLTLAALIDRPLPTDFIDQRALFARFA